MLSHHLASISPSTSFYHQGNIASTGICLSFSSNLMFMSLNYWILDYGATSHVCSNATLVTTIWPLLNSTVTLPNQTSILVSGVGEITLSSALTLRNVLFVQQFKFNLLSVSALTSTANDHGLIISFFHDSFCIQEIHSKKMIGKGE